MIEVSHNLFLVGMSYVIACFGSFTALQLATRIPTAKGTGLMGWVLASAVALGGGAIWSMHFIGMLAYNMPMQVEYDLVLTFGSLALAVVIASIGLFVVGFGKPNIFKLIFAGIAGGTGVAAMHYMGMAAMVMPADISYDQNIVILSIGIAIAAATVALWLAFNLTGKLQRFGSALVMGVAVCGMHYTAMSGVTMSANNGAEIRASFFTPETMALFIFAITSILLAILLASANLMQNTNQIKVSKKELQFE